MAVFLLQCTVDQTSWSRQQAKIMFIFPLNQREEQVHKYDYQ